jgi:superfamily II DNA helicase RecQ
MKMELIIGGKVIMIEAVGAVCVHVRDLSGAGSAAVAALPNAAPAFPDTVPTVADGGGLFAKLSDLRRELATAQNIPAYAVFQDKTLREMAEKMPRDLTEFGSICGVGKSKVDKYGELFLSLIKEAAA